MTKQIFAAGLKSGVASVALGAALFASPAFAQDAQQGDIIVTGSRIAHPNLKSDAPITMVGAEEIKGSGTTKIEDLTNQLPQVFAGQNSGVSNGADGTATVDLRYLGPSRTLVLVDGRRIMPGNIGGSAAADLNFIPSALVKRVDLLTGGASATYGADAVAGVVNFVMDRNFDGVRLDGEYAFYQHNNNSPLHSLVTSRFPAPSGNTVHGGSVDATLVLGAGFDDHKGHVEAYAGYRHESAITQADYDYSACTLNDDGNNYLVCGGSGTPAVSRFGGISAANATLAGLPSASSYTLTAANGVRPFTAADQYNYGPLNYFRRPSERFTAGAFADYEISPAFKPYLDVMFMDYSTQAQIAPSGAFYGVRQVNCDNPLLLANNTLATAICGANKGTATMATFLLGKRNVEGGARFNDIGFNQFRIVTGMKGDISQVFSYDAYFSYGQLKVANVYRNDVSSARINNALNVVSVGGVPTCASVVNGSDPACVPYNVFNNGGVTAAAANYINIPLVLTGTTRETVLSGTISGDLGKIGIQSPLAKHGISVAVGVERRYDALATQPDQAYINGDGAGQGGPTLPLAGSYNVTDVFGEASIPLAADRPLFHDLNLNLGFRHSNYNVPGATTQHKADTWKIEGSWQPVSDIRFRGSINRAVRSANIGELFAGQGLGLFGGTDPCTGPTPAASATACARTGVTAAQYGNILVNSANQYNQYGGGNLNLKPEKADTWTAGVQLTPSFVPNFNFSVDYFNIKVKDAVGTIGAQVILNQCLATGDANFCGLIHRGPAGTANAGSLWIAGPTGSIADTGYINNQTTNTGSLKTTGWDLNGDYRFNIGSAKVRWSFVGTVLNHFIVQPFTGGFDYDCAGYYGATCGGPAPKLRFNTNLRFALANNLAFTARWRYMGAVNLDTTSPDVDLNSPGASPNWDNHIKAQNYFDIQFALPLRDRMTLRLGVNNVFDKDPPIVSSSSGGGTYNGNTFPGVYDYLGRNIFVSFSADF